MWAGETFFPVVLLCCVSFCFWWEIGFGLHTHVLRVQYSCGVVLVFFILEKQLASQNMFLVKSELLLLLIFFLFSIDLHLYSHDCFSKISRPFCVSRNWWIIVVFLQSNSLRITILSQKFQDLLQPYSCDRFSKISRTFYASRNCE